MTEKQEDRIQETKEDTVEENKEKTKEKRKRNFLDFLKNKRQRITKRNSNKKYGNSN